MNKKVLITVSGGVATAFAESGVDVVIVDLDDANDTFSNEHVHCDFLPLINFAKAENACLVSGDGHKNDAYYMAPSESDLEVTLRFKPLTDLDLPPLGAPVFCLLKPGPAKKLLGDKPIILFLTTHAYFCGSGLSFIVQPADIEQWALVPALLGGCHAA
jgi:hypothetical protein